MLTVAAARNRARVVEVAAAEVAAWRQWWRQLSGKAVAAAVWPMRQCTPEQGCRQRQLGGVGSSSLAAEQWQLQGGSCGSMDMMTVQQQDSGGGSGSGGGDGSLVKARWLRHFGGGAVAMAAEYQKLGGGSTMAAMTAPLWQRRWQQAVFAAWCRRRSGGSLVVAAVQQSEGISGGSSLEE